MAKRRSKEETSKLIENVRNRVAAGETVVDACEEEGVHYSTYYNHIKADKKGARKAAKKTAAKGSRKNKVQTPTFQQLDVKQSGITILIISDDVETINNIISRYA